MTRLKLAARNTLSAVAAALLGATWTVVVLGASTNALAQPGAAPPVSAPDDSPDSAKAAQPQPPAKPAPAPEVPDEKDAEKDAQKDAQKSPDSQGGSDSAEPVIRSVSMKDLAARQGGDTDGDTDGDKDSAKDPATPPERDSAKDGDKASDPAAFVSSGGDGAELSAGERAATSSSQPSPLLAEARHRIDAGAFLGGNYFANELELGNAYHDDQVPTSAFLLGLRGTYLLIPHLLKDSSLDPSLSVEVEAKLAFSSTEGSTLYMRDSYSSPVLGWRAHAVLSLWNDRTLRPFALLGIGGETAFSSSPFVYGIDTDAALHWGLGATYKIADSYGVRADFRHGITAGRFALAASTVEFHAGFYYSFGFGARAGKQGAEPAPDPDDVKQMNDGDPDIVVEPLPTPKQTDTDGDGLLDDVDKCPDAAETVNSIQDEDGCPELDSDGDKILDPVDKCPAIAEDPDDYQDEDGCPDRDDDNDGRPDSVDECPNKPETLNGFEDENGCPDEIPADVQTALKNVLFRPRTTKMTTQKNLDKLKTALDTHPSIRLRIVGHAAGNEKQAQALSEQRAEAVKAYLTGAGIAADRLETVGHGADEPVGKNTTRLGKLRNRRVEFELIPGPASIPDPTAPAVPAAPAGDSAGTGAGTAPTGQPAGADATPDKAPADKAPADKAPADKAPADKTPESGPKATSGADKAPGDGSAGP